VQGPAVILIAAAIFGGLWIGLEWENARHIARQAAKADRQPPELVWMPRRADRALTPWRWRKCTITRTDAAWLSSALHEEDCPACDRPLAKHRR